MTNMSRYNFYFPDELVAKMKKAALKEAVERGEAMSVSEWLREAAREKLGET